MSTFIHIHPNFEQTRREQAEPQQGFAILQHVNCDCGLKEHCSHLPPLCLPRSPVFPTSLRTWAFSGKRYTSIIMETSDIQVRVLLLYVCGRTKFMTDRDGDCILVAAFTSIQDEPSAWASSSRRTERTERVATQYPRADVDSSPAWVQIQPEERDSPAW